MIKEPFDSVEFFHTLLNASDEEFKRSIVDELMAEINKAVVIPFKSLSDDPHGIGVDESVAEWINASNEANHQTVLDKWRLANKPEDE